MLSIVTITAATCMFRMTGTGRESRELWSFVEMFQPLSDTNLMIRNELNNTPAINNAVMILYWKCISICVCTMNSVWLTRIDWLRYVTDLSVVGFCSD